MTAVYDGAAAGGFAVRLALAAVFIAAALHALRDRDGFAAIVQAYRLLPDRAAGVAAAILPTLEILAAVGLLVPHTARFGGFLGLALMASFTGAIAINLWRGRKNIDCGCGGGAAQKLSWALVARNAVLFGLLGFSLFSPAGLPPLPALWVSAAGFAAFLALLYFSANQLLANAQALRAQAPGQPA